MNVLRAFRHFSLNFCARGLFMIDVNGLQSLHHWFFLIELWEMNHQTLMLERQWAAALFNDWTENGKLTQQIRKFSLRLDCLVIIFKLLNYWSSLEINEFWILFRFFLYFELKSNYKLVDTIHELSLKKNLKIHGPFKTFLTGNCKTAVLISSLYHFNSVLLFY